MRIRTWHVLVAGGVLFTAGGQRFLARAVPALAPTLEQLPQLGSGLGGLAGAAADPDGPALPPPATVTPAVAVSTPVVTPTVNTPVITPTVSTPVITPTAPRTTTPSRPDLSSPKAWNGQSLANQPRQTQDLFIRVHKTNAASRWAYEKNKELRGQGWTGPNQPPRRTTTTTTRSTTRSTTTPSRPNLSSPKAWNGQSLANQPRQTQDLFIRVHKSNAASRWAYEKNKELRGQGWTGPNQPPRRTTTTTTRSTTRSTPTPSRPNLSSPKAWDGKSLASQPKGTQDLFIRVHKTNAARRWADEHNKSLRSKGWTGPGRPPQPKRTSTSSTSSRPTPKPTPKPPPPPPPQPPPRPPPPPEPVASLHTGTRAWDGRTLAGESKSTRDLFKRVHGDNAAARWAYERNKYLRGKGWRGPGRPG